MFCLEARLYLFSSWEFHVFALWLATNKFATLFVVSVRLYWLYWYHWQWQSNLWKMFKYPKLSVDMSDRVTDLQTSNLWTSKMSINWKSNPKPWTPMAPYTPKAADPTTTTTPSPFPLPPIKGCTDSLEKCLLTVFLTG